MVTIIEDYVSFETAKLLKEKGFEGYSIITIYDENAANAYIKELREKHLPYRSDDPNLKEFHYTMPTIQMAMKWLREVHNLFIEIQCYGCEADEKAHFEYSYVISEYVKFNTGICTTFGLEERSAKSKFPSYEEACEESIKYCLENLI